jgi:hypothetical protein
MPDKNQIEGGPYPGIPPREPPDLGPDQQKAYNDAFHADRTRTRASFGLGPLTAHPEDSHAARDSEGLPYDTYGTTVGKRMIRKDAGPFHDQWNRENSRRNEWSEPRPAVSNADELAKQLRELTNVPNPYDSRKPPYPTPTTVGEMANVKNKLDHYDWLRGHPVNEEQFNQGIQLDNDYRTLKDLFHRISPKDVTTLAQWDKLGLLNLNNVQNLDNATLKTYNQIRDTIFDIAQRGGTLAGMMKDPGASPNLISPMAEGAASLLTYIVPGQKGTAFLGGIKAITDVARELSDSTIDTNRIVDSLDKTAVRNRQLLWQEGKNLSDKNYDLSQDMRDRLHGFAHENEQVPREDGGIGIGPEGNANHAKMIEVGADRNILKPGTQSARSPGQVEPTTAIGGGNIVAGSEETGTEPSAQKLEAGAEPSAQKPTQTAPSSFTESKFFPKELRPGGELTSIPGAIGLAERKTRQLFGEQLQKDWDEWAGPLWGATKGLFSSPMRAPVSTQGLGGFGAQTITPTPTPTPTPNAAPTPSATPVPMATPAPTPDLAQAPRGPTGLTPRLRAIAPAAEAVRSQFAPFLPRLPLERLNEPPAPKDYPPLNIPPTTSTRIPTQDEVNQMQEGTIFPWHDGNSYVRTA